MNWRLRTPLKLLCFLDLVCDASNPNVPSQGAPVTWRHPGRLMILFCPYPHRDFRMYTHHINPLVLLSLLSPSRPSPSLPHRDKSRPSGTNCTIQQYSLLPSALLDCPFFRYFTPCSYSYCPPFFFLLFRLHHRLLLLLFFHSIRSLPHLCTLPGVPLFLPIV